jgi:hypothetical protein
MMLLRANIHAGKRVLVADTSQGIVAAAATERLGGAMQVRERERQCIDRIEG